MGKAKNIIERLQEPKGPTDSQWKHRALAAEKQADSLLAALEKARSPRAKIKATIGKKAKGDFRRVIIPDTHGCVADPAAIAAFLGDLAHLKPSEIVMLGDHLECGGFLAQHHTLGYVAQNSYTFEDDVAATNTLLDAIQERCPGATIHYLEGNHERRIEQWCLTTAARSSVDALFLLRQFGTQQVLSLEKRGIHFYKQGCYYMDLPLPATIKLGKCHFTHGSSTAKHSSAVELVAFSGNVVSGHTHRAQQATKRPIHTGSIGAWCPGCLCKLQPLWRHTSPTDWTHGYGLQVVRSNGEFQHMNITIDNGRSFLVALMEL
jgi:predicted phosphodiesterase